MGEGSDEVREGGGEGEPAQVGCGLRPHLEEDQELPPTQARGPRQVQNGGSYFVLVFVVSGRFFFLFFCSVLRSCIGNF